MIKVLIVEDSKTAQEFLVHILSSDPSIQVIGIANNGAEAIAAVRQKRPHVITMDIHMPIVDGFEATREIMETLPTPIIIVSANTDVTEVASSFRAMEAGALAMIRRPSGIGRPEHEPEARELIKTVKLMSEIKVVRRLKSPERRLTGHPALATGPNCPKKIQVAAIGASTGGPVALEKILSALPHDLSFPLLIVQHIAPGFVRGFGEWLSGASRFPVHIASHGERPLPGRAYIAPENFHLGIGSGPHIVLSNHAPENGLRPSVAYLFRSVAQALGPAAAGILLTGMGKDGARELKTMKDMGAVTIAQSEESSIVYGMPGEAVHLNAATFVLKPEDIADLLASFART